MASNVLGEYGTALRLASVFITERCALVWWNHLTHGEWKKDGKGGTYIANTAHEHTPEAHLMTRLNMDELAHVITFAFEPPTGEKDSHWGIMYSSWKDVPWRKTSPSSLPCVPNFSIEEVSNRAKPVIGLRPMFRSLFSGEWQGLNAEHQCKVWFVFATTLVHELAHAYAVRFFGEMDEDPWWNQSEKEAELGFSWESFMFGRIINPHGYNLDVKWSPPLTSVHTLEWDPTCPLDRTQGLEPLMRTTDYHGATWLPVPIGNAANFRLFPSYDWHES